VDVRRPILHAQTMIHPDMPSKQGAANRAGRGSSSAERLEPALDVRRIGCRRGLPPAS
jgi:hypothetical protein